MENLGNIKNKKLKIAILIPCYNEEKTIEACVNSCLKQTRIPDEIMVVDDGSNDNTPNILKNFGNKITYLRLPKNTGNKSYVQEAGIKKLKSEIFIATDADTIVDKYFVENIEKDFKTGKVDAVCGYIKSIKENWITAMREIEYVLGQNIHKTAQISLNSVVVIPGCAAAFKTYLFKDKIITFDHDTVTEDLDFTYKLNIKNYKVVFNKKAIVYTQDPSNLVSYTKQISRWYRGGWQNLLKHYKNIKRSESIFILSAMYVESFLTSFLILLALIINPYFFFIEIIPMVILTFLVIGLYCSYENKRLDLLLYSPLYSVIMILNSYIYILEFFKVIILRNKNLHWYKPERRDIK